MCQEIAYSSVGRVVRFPLLISVDKSVCFIRLIYFLQSWLIFSFLQSVFYWLVTRWPFRFHTTTHSLWCRNVSEWLASRSSWTTLKRTIYLFITYWFFRTWKTLPISLAVSTPGESSVSEYSSDSGICTASYTFWKVF